MVAPEPGLGQQLRLGPREGKAGNCWCPDAKVECIRLGLPGEYMPSKAAVDATNDVTEGNQWLSRKDNGYRVYYLL